MSVFFRKLLKSRVAKADVEGVALRNDEVEVKQEKQMTTSRKAILLTGLGLLAVCSAMPFRRSTSDLESTAMAGPRLTRNWRGQTPVVPLQLKIDDADPIAVYAPRKRPSVTKIEKPKPRSFVASQVRLPEIPTTYQPLMDETDRPLFSQYVPAVEPSDFRSRFRSIVEEEQPRERRHRISDGDTLPQLAERYLGDANRYREIFAANRFVLPSPNILPIGAEILIPAR